MSNSRQYISITIFIAGVLLVFQLMPLFWGRPFYIDWLNHIWMTEYYAEYLRKFATFPSTIDVAQRFGVPSPTFYGIFFYPVCSVLSIAFGSTDIAVRLFCGILLIAPVLSFSILFQLLIKELSLAILISVTVNSSVYQLTNLYFRSALTEFAAVQLIMICISLIFIGVISRSKIANAALSFGFACGALGFGSHPITFYTFSLFVVPFLVPSCFFLRRKIYSPQLWRITGWISCALLILLPWIFTTIRYKADLNIGHGVGLAMFPFSIDSLLAKLGLFYFDIRVLVSGLEAVSTPFLDAPLAINILLIVIVVLYQVAYRGKKEFITFVFPTLILLFIFSYLIFPSQKSITLNLSSGQPIDSNPSFLHGTGAGQYLYNLLSPAQYLYRLSGTFSLATTLVLVIGFIGLARSEKWLGLPKYLVILSYISAMLALLGAGQKLYLCYVEFVQYPMIMNKLELESYSLKSHDISKYPSSFYGNADYIMPRLYPATGITQTKGRDLVKIQLQRGDTTVPFSCVTPCVLRTNIAPSKFHQVLIDGVNTQNVTISEFGNLDILAPAGEHSLEVKKLGRLWRYVSMSIWPMLFWFFGSLTILITLLGVKIFTRRPTDQVSEDTKPASH